MPLVSGTEILQAARKGGYAIGAFNTNNLEWTQAILQAAEAGGIGLAGNHLCLRARLYWHGDQRICPSDW